jgi:hypothetical protein
MTTNQIAQALIEAEAEICYDVAANVGQLFSNVKGMKWFVDAVADEVDGHEDDFLELLDTVTADERSFGPKGTRKHHHS